MAVEDSSIIQSIAALVEDALLKKTAKTTYSDNTTLLIAMGDHLLKNKHDVYYQEIIGAARTVAVTQPGCFKSIWLISMARREGHELYLRK